MKETVTHNNGVCDKCGHPHSVVTDHGVACSACPCDVRGPLCPGTGELPRYIYSNLRVEEGGTMHMMWQVKCRGCGGDAIPGGPVVAHPEPP